MASNTSPLACRWAFLAPWCEVLKGELLYGRVALPWGLWDTRRNTLNVTIRRDVSAGNITIDETKFQLKLRKTREALALLAVVAHADYAAWGYLLIAHFGIDVGKEGEQKFDDKIPVKLFLCLDWERDDEAGDYDLVKFCGVDQRDHPSEVYLEALAEVAALNGNVKPDWRGVDVQVPVHVSFSTDRIKDMDVSARELTAVGKAEQAILEEWKQYTRKSETQALSPGSLRCTFILAPVIADFLGMRMTSRMIETLNKLGEDNIWFAQVRRVRLELDKELWDEELESKKVFAQLLTGLFSHTLRKREVAVQRHRAVLNQHTREPEPSQMDQLQLFYPSTMLPADFVAVASAMAVDQTVKNLEIRLIPQSPAHTSTSHWWQWLAYALFSKRARAFSGLESVAIVKLHSMTVADMEKFTQVLTSGHPEETLFGSPRGELEERIATLKSGAAIRWRFNYRGEPLPGIAPLSVPTPTALVRAFSDDGVSEWVKVLIPGYGRCEVQRENLEFLELDLTDPSPRLSALRIEFINDINTTTSGLPLFLAAIGTSLKVLALEGRNLDVNITSTLQSCPDLDELSIGGNVIDVQLDLNCYREIRQPLLELSLELNNIVALSRSLCDSSSPFSKCVSRLRVRPANRWLTFAVHPTAFEADLISLLDMLAENRTLKYFEVTIPAELERYVVCFRSFNLQPTQHTSKLSLESKVAFISAVSAQGAAVDPIQIRNYLQRRSPLHRLGQDMICTIFAYASSPVPRQVSVRSEYVFLG
ncbi:hypothetical protein PHYPSEUDO_013293 [Phytophthora pseudosyringae]|uniref:Uncharacterized protein n=1 Tax=Phytophthora pseudosyringae TaxID=221518 RepID=A0A8T1V641_9STRA|nr:hypothetical protein PHYPSEUDO_013293 [Phytophthora pseudosyringae]